MRYLLTLKYDGSKFNGFQRLKNNDSVQKKLEEALSIIAKSNITVKGAGRTDRGVHANGQCCHFEANINIEPEKLIYVLNNIVRPYISITNCTKVEDSFHARHSVKAKHYAYKINLGEFEPQKADYYLQPCYKIDLKKLKKASKIFIGSHNYKNFVSGKRDNYESVVKDIQINIKNDIITINFYGKGFYRYMIRNMVGAMLEVARGNVDIEVVREMLEQPEIKKTLPVLPACGLYLEKIWY